MPRPGRCALAALLLFAALVLGAQAQEEAAEPALSTAASAEDAAVPTAAAAADALPTGAVAVLPTSGTTDAAVLAALTPPSRQVAARIRRGGASPQAAAAAASLAGDWQVDTPLPPRVPTSEKVQQEAAATAATVVRPTAASTIMQPVLAAHNNFRARHQNTPALVWSDTIAATAQAWADRCVFAHATGIPYGENLYMTTALNALGSLSNGVAAWYNEIAQYSYANPVFSTSTGHFTQVAWRTTAQLGCGAAVCNTASLSGTFLVCRYSPPGNYVGQFATNVMPLATTPAPSVSATLVPQNYYWASTTTAAGCLSTPNKLYRLCVQTDANLVLYKSTGAAIWASNTSGRSTRSPFRAVMQTDGNFVLYDAGNVPLWASGTQNRGVAPRRLAIQDDGNVVIYDANTAALWATNTKGR